MSKPEIYVSVDIESDGPIPADNSMLSLGAAAFTADGELLSTFSANLETLPGAKQDPDTMNWWSKNKIAYDATRENIVDPKIALEKFVVWIDSLDGIPVIVGYPVFFDYLFLYWYLCHFAIKNSLSFSALDIKSYASAVMKTPYRQSTKKNMPKRWFSDEPHTHVAVQDSIEQGRLFINMMKENLNKSEGNL